MRGIFSSTQYQLYIVHLGTSRQPYAGSFPSHPHLHTTSSSSLSDDCLIKIALYSICARNFLPSFCNMMQVSAETYSTVTAPTSANKLQVTLTPGVYQYRLTARNSNDGSVAYLGVPGYYSRLKPVTGVLEYDVNYFINWLGRYTKAINFI